MKGAVNRVSESQGATPGLQHRTGHKAWRAALIGLLLPIAVGSAQTPGATPATPVAKPAARRSRAGRLRHRRAARLGPQSQPGARRARLRRARVRGHGAAARRRPAHPRHGDGDRAGRAHRVDARLRHHRHARGRADRFAHRLPPGLAVEVLRRHDDRPARQRRRDPLGQPRQRIPPRLPPAERIRDPAPHRRRRPQPSRRPGAQHLRPRPGRQPRLPLAHAEARVRADGVPARRLLRLPERRLQPDRRCGVRGDGHVLSAGSRTPHPQAARHERCEPRPRRHRSEPALGASRTCAAAAAGCR